MKERSLIFMGSPDFAVAPLESLYRNGFNIKAVVTQPDKECGRGLNISCTALKSAALKYGIRVLQPEKMKDPAFIETLIQLNADLFVVVAFRILPAKILNLPELGSINLHASLLPDYRGAAPINHALFNGEKKTGVTVFFLNDREVDSGDIISRSEVVIDEKDNYGTLYEKLSLKGSEILTDTVKNIFEGNVTSFKQSGGTEKKAPKLYPDDFRIKWETGAESVHNRIRGLSPKPGAFTTFNGKRIKIISACFEKGNPSDPPGTMAETNCRKGYIKVASPGGFVVLDKIQLECKPVSDVKCFINGYRVVPGLKFE